MLLDNGIIKIKNRLLEILDILDLTNKTNWSSSINNFLSELNNVTNIDEFKIYIRRIKGIYGGSGSFSDLVLYRNSKPCVDENIRLNDLRRKLFKDIEEIITCDHFR